MRYEKVKYTKDKYWYINIHGEYGKWFAIYAQYHDQIVRDNNEGWNYEINHEYHWIPYFYDCVRYYYFKYNKPYETIVLAIDVWENRRAIHLESDDFYPPSDQEDDRDYYELKRNFFELNENRLIKSRSRLKMNSKYWKICGKKMNFIIIRKTRI